MAATLDDLLAKLGELKDVTEEAAEREETFRELERRSVMKNALSSEISKALGIPTSIARPFAFIGQTNQIVQDRREIMATLNKQSLAFNQSVISLKETAQVRAGEAQFGPQIALKTAIDSLRSGMFNQSKNIFDLGMQMRAVGESSDTLFRVQRESQVMGGTTITQMDALAKSLENARSEYGMSTEYLVDS